MEARCGGVVGPSRLSLLRKHLRMRSVADMQISNLLILRCSPTASLEGRTSLVQAKP
jgi:hypothetical protein